MQYAKGGSCRKSSRLSTRRPIWSGMREARKWNSGVKQCCCCHQLCPKVLRAFWEENHPEKGGKVFRMPSRTPIPAGKRHLAQHKKGNPPLTILPAHSSPHLPNNERSSVPGASSSSLLDNSMMCKVYNEYEICNIQRVGLAGRAGFESMFIDWNPPSPIPDWLSDMLPGWVLGFFTFFELESSRLLSRRVLSEERSKD